MEKIEEIYKDNNSEIDAKLNLIHKDLKRLMERSNREFMDLMVANLKREFLNSINSYISDDVETGLERGMVEDCEMRETCKSRFTSYLLKNEDLILGDNVSTEIIDKKKAELSEIRKGAPFEICDECFSEVQLLFNKQLGLINSIKTDSTNNEKTIEISSIPHDRIVKTVLEPLSNEIRLQIITSMASETRTFSSLSELTGLRGGNLLFHLQKLLENDLIIQLHDRGDYMITKKGFNLLLILLDINKLL